MCAPTCVIPALVCSARGRELLLLCSSRLCAACQTLGLSTFRGACPMAYPSAELRFQSREKLISIGGWSRRSETNTFLKILCTFWWLVWKERNKSIFENSESSAQQVASNIEEKVNALHSILF
jgi:hypothetical protein